MAFRLTRSFDGFSYARLIIGKGDTVISILLCIRIGSDWAGFVLIISICFFLNFYLHVSGLAKHLIALKSKHLRKIVMVVAAAMVMIDCDGKAYVITLGEV